MTRRNYLIQALIKSRMGPGYMAAYLNTMLRMYTQKPNTRVVIDIWGACWGRAGKSGKAVNNLVDLVFDRVPTSSCEINLRDHYPRFDPVDIKKALVKKGYATYIAGKLSNHGKIVRISENNEVLFLMLGSSNFSYNTYASAKNFIDQADVAFITAKPESADIILPITHFELDQDNGNLLLEPWAQESVGAEENNENDELWADYMSEGREDRIINTIYSSKDELLLWDDDDDAGR
jgi:hypothetical protein